MNLDNRKKISGEEWGMMLNKISLPKRQLNQIVMDYLITEGYKEAAEQFASESGTTISIDLESLDERRIIRDCIMNGEIDKAIELVNDIDVDILDSRPELYFTMRMQNLVEFIKQGKVVEALNYGQCVLAQFAKGNQKLLKELERAMSLMVFEDPLNSPVADLVETSQRQKVASMVNEAILESQGQVQHSKLKLYMKLLLWSQRRASEVVNFPIINDLANPRLEEQQFQVQFDVLQVK